MKVLYSCTVMKELISSVYYKMTKVSKYGRCEPDYIERDFESVRNDDVGLNAASLVCSSKTTCRTIRWEKLFCGTKHSSYRRRAIG